ncbi:MAG: hypothetical protein ACL93V_07395 [Candidatus Electrothrix sp. YB6]
MSNDNAKKTNVQLGAEVEFLGAVLQGAYQTVGDNTVFVVKQMNAGENARPISLADLQKDIKALAGGEITLPEMKDEKGNDFLKTYKLILKQAYLKIETKADNEYALWLTVEADEEKLKALKETVPAFKIVSLKKIGIKVWNTSNPAVLDEMNFVDIKQLVGIGAEEEKQIEQK